MRLDVLLGLKKHPGIAGYNGLVALAVVLAPKSIWQQTEAVCR